MSVAEVAVILVASSVITINTGADGDGSGEGDGLKEGEGLGDTLGEGDGLGVAKGTTEAVGSVEDAGKVATSDSGGLEIVSADPEKPNAK